MCGIAGFVDFKNTTSEKQLHDMVASINHRGPDDTGIDIFSHSDVTIGFGHARLSIIDLSNGGHQPMSYEHLTIVFNGEIYNYLEIKNELIKCGHTFVTGSDTEVILHAYFEWGQQAIDKFVGMFAMVLLDKKRQQIVMICDRPGVKPLYYYWYDGLLLFGSELKVFHRHPSFMKSINLSSLKLYFKLGYIPAPHCIFNYCYKVEAGNILTFDIINKSFLKHTYWNINDCYLKEKSQLSYTDAKDQLHNLLKSACNYRMVSDVPVGVFLSGGYDSTAVCAILQTGRTEKLKTFTIGFEEGYNEAPFAKETAAFLGTEHTEYICTTTETRNIIPSLPYFFDEPFTDTSAIPTILVSEQARKKVTVALSADGGDEIFAGYGGYPTFLKYLNSINKIPDNLKVIAGSLLSKSEKFTPGFYESLKYKMYSVAETLKADSIDRPRLLYTMMRTLPEVLTTSLFSHPVNSLSYEGLKSTVPYEHPLEAALTADFQVFLSNVLTKVDRATMSVSLEGREPLLDHHLVEFSASLPMSFKFNKDGGKRILKDIVHDYVPKEMMNRPKAGFSLPVYNWLRSDLSYLIDEYLNETAIKESGYFNASFVNEQVKLFRNKKLHYTPLIWYLLMFQMWYKRWM